MASVLISHVRVSSKIVPKYSYEWTISTFHQVSGLPPEISYHLFCSHSGHGTLVTLLPLIHRDHLVFPEGEKVKHCHQQILASSCSLGYCGSHLHTDVEEGRKDISSEEGREDLVQVTARAEDMFANTC